MVGRAKGAVEFALLALVLAAGLIMARPKILLFALPLATHLLLGTLLARAIRPKLQAHRALPSCRLVAGETLEARLTVENRGRGQILAQVLGDPPLAEFAKTALLGSKFQVDYKIEPKRGRYLLSGPFLRCSDLLGFWTWEGELSCPEEVWVYPRTERVSAISFSPRATLSAPGGARSQRAGVSGVVFYGTRPFLPGDDPRRLNWKALARRTDLVLNLYEETRAAVVTIVLDGRAEAYAKEEELFEAGVVAAASLSRSLLADGHRVGLLLVAGGVEWVKPGAGRAHGETILLSLAQAQLQPSEAFPTLAYLPWEYFPKGSAVVAILPLRPEESEAILAWRAKGLEVVVLGLIPSKDMTGNGPEALAERFLALERALALRRLWAGGVRTGLWDGKEPLSLALRELSREKRWSRV